MPVHVTPAGEPESTVIAGERLDASAFAVWLVINSRDERGVVGGLPIVRVPAQELPPSDMASRPPPSLSEKEPWARPRPKPRPKAPGTGRAEAPGKPLLVVGTLSSETAGRLPSTAVGDADAKTGAAACARIGE